MVSQEKTKGNIKLRDIKFCGEESLYHSCKSHSLSKPLACLGLDTAINTIFMPTQKSRKTMSVFNSYLYLRTHFKIILNL